jgi:uncharacterized protein
MKTITISVQGITLKAELADTPTAQAIWQVLPIEGAANRWGDEIYFEIPVAVPQEPEAHADVEVGELGYWPVGNAFCIFFGPTPASSDQMPRAASPVNVFGQVAGDAKKLKSVKNGATVWVSRGDLSSLSQKG